MPFIDLPPHGTAMAQSLRSVGYTPVTAIADIVDNSVAAGASEIVVHAVWNDGAPFVDIFDDGRGMNERTLRQRAMKLGGICPRSPRDPTDLGRFGFGLKSAAWSLGTRLEVYTKSEGELTSAAWDLGVLERENRWSLEVDLKPEAAGLLSNLAARRSGTLVRISGIDRFNASEKPTSRDDFFNTLQAASEHLGTVFHRFIDRGLAVRIGRIPVRACNPVASDLDTTIHFPPVSHQGHSIEGFVVEPKEEAATADQGFYVYRADRLLVRGGWLGIGSSGAAWQIHEDYCLARVAIDLRQDVDREWSLNIAKSSVRPPSAARDGLRTYASKVREEAKRVLRAKFAPRSRPSGGESDSLWLPTGHESPRFIINRGHPAAAYLAATPDGRRLLSRLESEYPVQIPDGFRFGQAFGENESIAR